MGWSGTLALEFFCSGSIVCVRMYQSVMFATRQLGIISIISI